MCACARVSPPALCRWFETYKEADFARAGDKATETIELAAGPLPQFAHSIEPHLRKLGLPSSLDKGVVTLLKDHTVCKAGEVLNADKANVLVRARLPGCLPGRLCCVSWPAVARRAYRLGPSSGGAACTAAGTVPHAPRASV